MRILLLFLTLALAGCFAEEAAEPDLFGACPQWVAGPDVIEASNATMWLAPPLEHDGRPLDMFLIVLRGAGDVRAYHEDGTRILIKKGQESLPVVTVDGETEVRLFLTPVTHGTAADPAPVRLEASGQVDVSATPFYRVCGVPKDTSST